MNIEKFIEKIITSKDVKSIIDEYDSQSDKGFIFERLWDICIKFGFCDEFPNSKVSHMIGNVNDGKLKTLKSFNTYLKEKVISGNSGGCSDITMLDHRSDEYIFMSSKYTTESKSVDYYDVQKIITMIDHNKYEKYKIYILVSNRIELLETIKNSNKSSKYITKYMTNILDINDLNKCFLKFQKDYLGQIKTNKTVDFNSYISKKENLNLRFHQEMISQKTSDLIKKGNKTFLWGCKCRSGKTFIFGGLVIKELRRVNKLNVLLITPSPSETIPQFTEDLFDKYNEFEQFKVHYLSEEISKSDIEENNIFVSSKQLLQKYTGYNRLKILKRIKFDIIVFDENHFGGTTKLSKNILETYSTAETVNIYMTATYNKPLKEWNISGECKMYWDIEDEQNCKLATVESIEKLNQKHGKCVFKTIKYYNDIGLNNLDIFNKYKRMPDLHILSMMFDNVRYEQIKNKIMGSKYGFCFDVLFALNSTKDEFIYESDVKKILRYISGSNKERDFPNGDMSIYGRINTLCKNKKSRTPFTQIWFLPSDNINNTSECLVRILKEDKKFKNYKVLAINRQNKDLAQDVKLDIINAENKAKKNKDGLILLAGNMLSLGISLENCDVVFLMNDGLSSDKVLQQMYRCMTDSHEKNIGIVVDFNISRVLNTCINYNVNENTENKIEYLINNHLINIDNDLLYTKQIDSNKIINKLMESWKLDPVNNYTVLLKNLDYDYVDFDTSTQKLINKTFMNQCGKTIGMKIIINDQKLQNGKEIKTIKSDDNFSDSDYSSESSEKTTNISFTKDVLPYVIPLSCILTIKEKNKDFVKMLEYIKNNKELLEIFNDMSLIWWNKTDLIDIITSIISKNFDKKSSLYNISIQFKLSLMSLIDNPDKLLSLINECLAPKREEKNKMGEVFTPISFVEKMLSQLEKYYTKTYKKNIYEQPDLTWFDPAAGMGNYPIVVYYKLMEGLKSQFKDPKLRKKHILENMIYMSELNKRNCFVLEQVFNINSELKLNLFKGDSLKLDIHKTFKRKSFDVIIGNPPYNEELTKVGAKPLYNQFIEYYMDRCQLLTFVVQSRWFSGGKGLDKFRDYMLNRKDIVYINHLDDASLIFKGVDIKGGINYFLKDTNFKSGETKMNGIVITLNKYDVLVDGKYHPIIDKMIKYANPITKIYQGRCFGIESNDKRLLDKQVDKQDDKTIKCYVSQQKGFVKYISIKDVKKEYNYYKVITARAAHAHKSGFGNMFVGLNEEIHTGSYISFRCNSLKEAKSLLCYLKCKLPNFMLSLRKNSQDISDSTCAWIPLPPLDRKWDDIQVYEYFKLTPLEMNLISNTLIKYG